MLPVRLKFGGLNSYVHEVTIDFTRFYESRLFGIFGETGGGKSTILDAMILALFGRTPRLPTAKIREAINPLRGQINIEFLFEISGERYKIQRTISESTTSVRLYKFSGEKLIPLTEKSGEFQNRITNLVGLTYEEFCKVVILPQNQFAEILRLEPATRAKLMGNLFDLDSFGEPLYERFSQKYSELETALREKQSRLNELSNITKESILSKEKQLSDLENEVRDLEKTRLEKLQKISMLKNFQQLSEHKERLEKALKKIEERMPEIEGLKQRIQIDDELAPLKRSFGELNNLCQSIETNVQRIQLLEKELVSAETTLKEKKTEKEEFEKQASVKIEELIGRIKEAQQLCELESEIKDLAGKGVQKEKGIKELEMNLVSIEEELRKCHGESEKLKVEIEAVQTSIAKSQLSDLELKMYEVLPKAMIKIKELKNLESDIGQLAGKKEKEIRRQAEYLTKVCSEFMVKLNMSVTKFEDINEALISRNSEVKSRREEISLELEGLKTKGMAYVLSRNLVDGLPCPVCGSTEHPNPAHEIDQGKIAELEDALKSVDLELEALEAFKRNISPLVEKLIESKTSIQNLEEQIREKTIKLVDAKRELSQTLSEEYWNIAEKLYEDLTTRKSKIEQLTKKLNKLNGDLYETTNKKYEVASKKVLIATEIEQLKRELEDVKRLLEEKRIKLYERTGGKTPDEMKKEAEKELETLKSNQGRLEKEVLELEDKTQKVKLEIEKLKQATAKDRQRYEEIRTALEAKAMQLNVEVEGLASLILDEKTKSRIKAEIEHFEREWNKTKGALETVIKNLSEIPIETLNLGELKETEAQLAQVEEGLKRLSENIGTIKEQIRTEKSLLAEKDNLTKELSTLQKEFENVRILKSLTQGKEMVKFFAWHLLRQIIRLANEILTSILGRRFHISVNPNLEFHVLDMYYNRERSINTLSGGETFVVSFALALALSSYIQSKRKRMIQFFFIDEGFSSLDKELMDSVSSVLNELKSQDRLVGFITHVDEMKNLIPHSIQVKRDFSGSSTLSIRFS